MKKDIKVGTVLVDDVRQLYEVIEKMTNCVILAPYPNEGDFACEIMTYSAMESEGWKVVNGSL